MKTGIGKYIGLATLASISLTCDSKTKTFSSNIKDQKSDIENVFTLPPESSTVTVGTTKYISKNSAPQIIDTLVQGDISSQDITTTDTIKIENNNNKNNKNNITDDTERGSNNNIVMGDISSKENIKKILSKEECKNMCDKQIIKAIVEIIPETEKIEFDINYMRGEAYSLFTHFFTIQDTEDGTHIIFSKIQENDKSFVINHMDNMKNHIKENNGFWIKLLLTKGDLKDYIMNGSEEDEKPNIQKLYEIITNTGSINYEGGESQFKKDVESVINLY